MPVTHTAAASALPFTRLGAAYIRVSTGKQEELSPDSQKRLILDYAQSHDIVIPKEFIFIENGISGRKADKRPKFQEMIGLAKAKQFDVILLWKFSRFARNQEESIVYKSMLRKNGVEVVSISEPLVDGPFGSLIERIIEWMDEFYSIRLSGDVTRGMTEKAMRGGYQCRPPLGYTIPYHNATLQIVPEEAKIIQKIFDDYVYQKYSSFQIARRLNCMGVKTSHGNPFEKRSIEYILDNPCYAGYVRWNKKENSTNLIKNEEEWIIRPGIHQAIISKDTFEAAQTRRRSECRPKSQRPNVTYKHWLSGLLKCSSCGRTLTASTSRNKYGRVYQSFQCYGYTKGKCPVSHSISAAKIEPAVLSAIKEAIDYGEVELSVQKPKRENDTTERQLILSLFEQLKRKEKRVKAAYENGIDTIEDYSANKQKLYKEKKELEEKLDAMADPSVKEIIDNSMVTKISSLYDILISEDFSISEKSTALQSVVEKIVFDKENFNIDIYFFDLPETRNLL